MSGLTRILKIVAKVNSMSYVKAALFGMREKFFIKTKKKSKKKRKRRERIQIERNVTC